VAKMINLDENISNKSRKCPGFLVGEEVEWGKES